MAIAATSYPAPAVVTSLAEGQEQANLPAVLVPGDDAPVRKIDHQGLRTLATRTTRLFEQYRRDRRLQELRWIRNLRQYLGYYDPEVESALTNNRSRAYPKVTRVKCISMKARIMDLMFPSDDKNWTIEARPSPDMDIKDVMQAVKDAQARDQAAGQQVQVDSDYVQEAVNDLAMKRAQKLTTLVDDQLQEIGGDQTYDYVALNGEVVQSGIRYGLGLALGPFAREVKTSSWVWDEASQQPKAKTVTNYMPQFEFLRVWDFYPDLASKRLEDGDGYFIRYVMSRHQLRKLADRSDFFGDAIRKYLAQNTVGNYVAQEFETELRTMGVKENVNEQQAESSKYEIIAWHGPVDGTMLRMAGIDVADDKLADEMQAEVWTIAGIVIKTILNPWASIKADVRMVHWFLFDHDDTSPIGFGLPNVLRDTQMSISAATRMMLDNASVVCGPILEMNTALLRADQDLSALSAYKIFYRDDDGPSAQFPAVRQVEVNGHIPELQGLIKLFLDFADMETFVGPATGGDLTKLPGEPMRNAAGASMLLGNAALPFKEIIRQFDRFTTSMIQSVVDFNRQFNPDRAETAAYDVIARGATSLVAKEIRGMQVDQLATSMTPEEKMHVDLRKLVEARFAVRDLSNMLVSEKVAAQRQAAADQAQSLQTQLSQAGIEATTRKLLSDAFKNIATGQKNQMTANSEAISAALDILAHGNDLGATTSDANGPQGAGGGPAQAPQAQPGQPSLPPPDGAGGGLAPPDAGGAGLGALGGLSSPAG